MNEVMCKEHWWNDDDVTDRITRENLYQCKFVCHKSHIGRPRN